MAFKRPFHEDGDTDGLGFLVQEPKRRLTFNKVAMDVMRGISMDELVSRLVPLVQSTVREEVERAFLTFCTDFSATPRTSLNQGRTLQLLFVNKLPSTIFTGSKIEAEDDGPIKIELIDPISKTRITSGPYSSIKIQILVLNGDFGSEDQENWTELEFKDKEVREREGKRPLLAGERNIKFQDGVGIISDMSFTDNSSWIRCRKFRLGARVLKSTGGQVRIKEARSEAFMVKDHRGEQYKKHYPPSLNDEVWRLEKIGKDGKYHTRLASSNIHSVKDFLRLYVIDPTSLKRMLHCPNQAWDVIVEHASTCEVNNEILFTYAAEGIVLVFNSVYKLVAATFDGQNYQSLDDLTYTQKPLVETIKKQAYRNVNSFVLVDPVDGYAIFGPSKPLISLQAEPFNSPTSGLQHPEFPVAHQGSSEIQSGFNHASPSTSYNYELEGHSQQSHFSVPGHSQLSHFSVAQNIPPTQAFNPMCRNNSFKMADLFSPCIEEMVGNFASEVMSQALMSNWPPVNAEWPHSSGIFFASTSGDSDPLSSFSNFGVHISSRNGKTKAAWCKIRAVIKWRAVQRGLGRQKNGKAFLCK